mmetsp:Transcript_16346/g.33158  ORF Transcript_16346/g.33158 Transcript_16346/m.33158 type:complete len:111 (-) Transcript_16346:291-623(-)
MGCYLRRHHLCAAAIDKSKHSLKACSSLSAQIGIAVLADDFLIIARIAAEREAAAREEEEGQAEAATQLQYRRLPFYFFCGDGGIGQGSNFPAPRRPIELREPEPLLEQL